VDRNVAAAAVGVADRVAAAVVAAAAVDVAAAAAARASIWQLWARLGAQFWRLFLAIAADNFARIANFYWIGYFLKPHKKTTHTIRSFEIFTNVFSCYFSKFSL